MDKMILQVSKVNVNNTLHFSRQEFGPVGTRLYIYAGRREALVFKTPQGTGLAGPAYVANVCHKKGNSRYFKIPAAIREELGFSAGRYITARYYEESECISLKKATMEEISLYATGYKRGDYPEEVRNSNYIYLPREFVRELGVRYGEELCVTVNAQDKAFIKVRPASAMENLKSLVDSKAAYGEKTFFSEERSFSRKHTGPFGIPNYFLRKFGIKPGDRMKIYMPEDEDAIIVEPPERHCDFCGTELHGYTEPFEDVEVCDICSDNMTGARHLIASCGGDIRSAAMEARRRLAKIVC